MSINSILAEIDVEIARLPQVRSLLAPTAGKTKKAGKTTTTPAAAPKKKAHKMSKEGRAKIAEARKKRWAAQKKAEK
jgi:hypothetical protein